ncbi:MAG: hypothetical protein PHP70_00090 [Gallionella sp.]|nr:hypothetical protein [Gallionella sp.]
MAAAHNPSRNIILAALPAAELKRLTPHLEPVAMPLGEIFCEPGGDSQYVYFPTTSVVSLHYVMQKGTSAEIAGVGMVNEGLLGILLFMGGHATTSRAFVRTAGYGYKLNAQLLVEEFKRAGPIQHLLLHYTRALANYTSQVEVCNLQHLAEATVPPNREYRFLNRAVCG